jgi:tRNA(Ile)-lysidine synthase
MGLVLDVPQRVAAVGRLRRAVTVAIDRRQVLHPGEGVVVACSGGPDSMALLDALARLAPPRGLRLHVAHVDHGLRPGSADEAGRVRAAAARHGLPFTALSVTVAPRGSSLQDRARVARHAALGDLADGVGAEAIALGHTADDQAETVLMRALSGATPRALAAMAERSGRLARPLLRTWRADVVAYCAALGIEVLEDPSNADARFLRTRVRHELVPALERVFPAARRRLCALAEHQRRLVDAQEVAQAGGEGDVRALQHVVNASCAGGSNSDPLVD